MDKQEMVCPKKDTCIFASKKYGHCVPHFKTEGCTGCFGDGGVVYSLGCVPVEPAQPELPREDIVNQLLEDAVKKLSVELRQALKRIAEMEEQSEHHKLNWLNCLEQIKELEADRDAYNSAYYSTLGKKEEQDKEIASLKALVENETSFYDVSVVTIKEQDKEITSLKKQLAVFTKDIPKGEYCYVREKSNNTWCEHEIGGSCHLLGVTLDWQRDYDAYTKAPGCPVPAKEEAK